MLVIFVMIQMRRCSDHKNFSLFVQSFSVLAFEEMEPITVGKYKITNVKFKSSEKDL